MYPISELTYTKEGDCTFYTKKLMLCTSFIQVTAEQWVRRLDPIEGVFLL